MLLYAFALAAGLIMLVWAADRTVVGAAVTARLMGVSPMLIGLTVVGFATSAPELVVSATAALDGVPNLAIGNAVGSNIANIGLVGGLTAICWPLVVKSQTMRREFPVIVAASILPVIFIPDAVLSRIDGWILLGAFGCYFYWIIRLGLQQRGHDVIEAEYASEIPGTMPRNTAIMWVCVGIAGLVAGSKALVWGASNLASALGVSETLLGLTVVAVGTSLPELAVSFSSARKGEHALAFGNIIGSNGFNMLAVIGLTAAIKPVALDEETLTLHFPVMVAFTVVFFFLAYNYSGTMRIRRWAGALLLAGFCAYHGYVVYETF